MSKTNIEWTNETLNPTSGCSRKSEGCRNCYAETMTRRLDLMGNEKYQGLLTEDGRFNGVIKFDEKSLLNLLTIKKPTTFFINSMSDLFHENIPDEWIDKVFGIIARCPQHTFQILAKRADRMRDYFQRLLKRQADHYDIDLFMEVLIEYKASQGWKDTVRLFDTPIPFANCWLGVSVENQKAADERIPLLLETPAAIRFLSCEPLLEPIDLTKYLNSCGVSCSDAYCQDHSIVDENSYELAENNEPLCKDCGEVAGWMVYHDPIDWVIVGGESGQNKLKLRSCNLAWIRSIVDQCKSAGVPVFIKQLGTNSYYFDEIRVGEYEYKTKNHKGGDINEFPEDLRIRQMPTEGF